MKEPGLLRGLLRSVSRSIYMSLRVLPGPIRDGMGLAYLLCRAADTIADTRVVPRVDRRRLLLSFRDLVERPDPPRGAGSEIGRALEPRQDHASERALLLRLDECLRVLQGLSDADRNLVRGVVRDVVEGMLLDLEHFPGEDSVGLAALPDRATLDRYCLHIGGCPGRFWTRLCFGHLESMSALSMDRMLSLATDYGKGLQMTNILRDLPSDLRIGRCYMPSDELRRAGLGPGDLLGSAAWSKFRPVFHGLLEWSRELLDSGLEYVLEIPRTEARLRVACAWPLLLARKTLALLESNAEVLEPKKRIKVGRKEVYKIMAWSSASVYSQSSLRRLYARQGRA